MNQSSFNLAVRHLGLGLASLLAGALSSGLSALTDRTAPVRGALLGGALALGLAGLNLATRRRLDAGQPPGWGRAALVGGLAGLLAGAAVALWGWWADVQPPAVAELKMFWLQPARGGAALLLGLGWGLGLHLAYAARWRFRSASVLRTFFWMAMVGLALGSLRAALVVARNSALDPLGVVMVGMFTGPPFALAWAAAVWALDPAWSAARWRQIAGPTEPPGLTHP